MNVYDLDSHLSFPCSFESYFSKTFLPLQGLLPERYFRVIPHLIYLTYFSSDRSHMKNSSVPPPTWPLIKGCHSPNSNTLSVMRRIEGPSSSPTSTSSAPCSSSSLSAAPYSSSTSSSPYSILPPSSPIQSNIHKFYLGTVYTEREFRDLNFSKTIHSLPLSGPVLKEG